MHVLFKLHKSCIIVLFLPVFGSCGRSCKGHGSIAPPPLASTRVFTAKHRFYVCRECQRKDWKRHKIECQHLASLGMNGKPYPVPYNSYHCPAAELDKMYREWKPRKEQKEGALPECEICGRTTADCRIEVSECCQVTGPVHLPGLHSNCTAPSRCTYTKLCL